MSEIIVKRKNHPNWIFKLNNGRFECKQRKHTYRIMFNITSCKPIWIGLVLDDAIVTIEREIGARSVRFEFGEYIFD